MTSHVSRFTTHDSLFTALITGATGFVGSHLARRLVEDGWNVHIIIRASSSLDLIKDVLDRIVIHEHDGTTEAMVDIIGKAKPAIVFHLASLFISQHQSKDIGPLNKSNVLFGTQLVEAMVINEVYKLVNTGTSWQHYNNEPYNPVNLYAATKQAFEDILRYYVEATPLKVITLKLYDTYGPNDPRPKLFSLLRKVAQEQIELAMSPGEQLIDLVYIDDVVDAYLIAAGRLLSGKVKGHKRYAVSSGSPIRLKDLVKIFEQELGTKLPIRWGSRPYRSREVMVPWNKGEVLPGWKPRINLEEGILKICVESECREI